LGWWESSGPALTRRDPKPCGDDLQAEAAAEAARIEAAFTDEALEALIRAKGLLKSES
jgi:hypothetical protein